jgi:cold shock CspA family protein
MRYSVLVRNWSGALQRDGEMSNQNGKPQGKPKSGWVEAVVKSFNPRKGWGFLISPATCRDIFVHKGVDREEGINLPLTEGQRLMVRYRDGKSGGFKATQIKLPAA